MTPTNTLRIKTKSSLGPDQCRKWRTPVKTIAQAALVGRGDHLGVAHATTSVG
jgi:hypothetical protein